MSERTDTERLDWLANTWGTLAGCVTNVGKGDEWYWRFDHPDERPGFHGAFIRQAIDAAMDAEEVPDGE